MIAESLHTLRKALPSGVELVAVSKFHPVERLMEAYEAGQRVFAESRPQELAAKVPQLPSDIQWHFIGHLQTNKLKLVLPYVSLVQSVDSLHLLQAISAWGTANNKVVDVLLELHLGAEETKQGFSEDEILALLIGAGTPSETHGHPRPCKREGPAAEGCGRGLSEAKEVSEGVPAPMAGIRIRGLMGMATNTDDMAVVEKDFERIEALYNKIKASGREGFDVLSIGMSQDWPVAVRHGATMVRIGTDIFGPREY
ncbi:MAG: YggS family pyridoxal phosphate enzyme [Bacteroidales bacterium]|nr:YggS family pyridoxal phosphate enzyme [Bacteroidales bacterium]